MKNEQTTAETETQKTARSSSRTAILQQQIEQRDETIRLLNEALSLALDDLNGLRKAA